MIMENSSSSTTKNIPFRFSLSLCIIMFLLPIKSKAEQLVDFNVSYGIGARHAGFAFPLPTANVHLKLGKGQAFVEVSANPIIILTSTGYEYPLSKRGSAYVAILGGGSIGPTFSGYKVGFTYNSNKFNESGWITSIELYSFTKTQEDFDLKIDVDKTSVFPAISFGYQW